MLLSLNMARCKGDNSSPIHVWENIKTFSFVTGLLKVHKIENFFDSDFGICVISLLVMPKY